MAPTPSYVVILIAVAIVLVAAGGIAGYVYLRDRPQSPPTVTTVQIGDNVTVNYIGIFGSGPEQGKVFDTSFYAVAINDATYPKSLQYHPRGLVGNYTPLAVHVGNGTPSGGYSYNGSSFISVVTGFWEGLLGLPLHGSRLISVSPDLGYGPQNPACLRTEPLTVHVPIVQTMSGANFSARFTGTLATTGATFADPTYGWPVLILSANQSSVTIENLPTAGYASDQPGWTVEVTNITQTASGSGQITVVNELSPTQDGLLGGHTSSGLCSSESNGNYIISSVNIANGTYTEDFNQEVTGQTLLFAVTIVQIYAPASTVV
jgi:FKBP-type peptidyl-prolyl cis-trans isomerase 2